MVDGAGRHVRVHVPPDLAQQLFTVHDLLAALRKVSQQLELARAAWNRR
jgi:hypothetical protein